MLRASAVPLSRRMILKRVSFGRHRWPPRSGAAPSLKCTRGIRLEECTAGRPGAEARRLKWHDLSWTHRSQFWCVFRKGRPDVADPGRQSEATLARPRRVDNRALLEGDLETRPRAASAA